MENSDPLAATHKNAEHRGNIIDSTRCDPRGSSQSKGRHHELALCLSGGGFRAALFHLGVVRRLNEFGILPKISTISSVSGGSVISAFLAERLRSWPKPGTILTDWEDKIARPFRALARNDMVTAAFFKRLLPWNWFKSDLLVDIYLQNLTRMTMRELPDQPQFIFSATDLFFGVNWIFTKEEVGDWQVGYIRPAPNWPVALAAAASSSYPLVFRSMPIHLASQDFVGGNSEPVNSKRNIVSHLWLSDGGLYDNLALEPVWKNHRIVLVSDGGALFEFESCKRPLRRVKRYLEVIAKQSLALRKRWLRGSYDGRAIEGVYWWIGGTFWGTSSVTKKDGSIEGYSAPLARELIARIRTDMDAFSEAEISVLENHGYVLADAAIKHSCPSLIETSAPLSIPHPTWMNEGLARQALCKSHKRITCRRFISLFKTRDEKH